MKLMHLTRAQPRQNHQRRGVRDAQSDGDCLAGQRESSRPVIEVAEELQAAAGKRDRDGADPNFEATARLEEKEGTLEADVERLRKMKLIGKPKVGAAPLATEGEEQDMEVDSDEDALHA